MTGAAAVAAPAMPVPLRTPLGVLAVLAALAVGALSIGYHAGATATGFDGWLQPALVDVRPPLRGVALVIDFGGEPLGAALLVAVLVAACRLTRHRRTAVLAVVGPGCTVAATTLLKPVVGRTIHGEFLSFPSGHTGLATALALVLTLLLVDLFGVGRAAGLLLVLTATVLAAAAMAWSQVSLGAHYPSDTIGGFGTALAVVPATAWLVDRAASGRAN